MKYLLLRIKRFCGFITGFVFFIGGILKLMDPVGAGLVMGEYLDFMHWHPAGWRSSGLYHLPAKEGTDPYSSLGLGVVTPYSGFGRYFAGN